MTEPTTYNITISDRGGNRKQDVTPFATGISWTWNTKGGCGRAKMTLHLPYRHFDINAMDDVQIRIKDLVNGGTKLAYRGWIAKVSPKLAMSESISLDIRGYFDLFKRRIVQDDGEPKEYEGDYIHEIVEDILDTYITPTTSITKGTIDTSSFSADYLEFEGNAFDVMNTLAGIDGGIEYGVDQDLVFFWRTQSNTVRKKFVVGADVQAFNRKVDYDKLVNKIYFEGGKVAGSPYKRISESTDSQYAYGLSEKIIVNSSIQTTSVADQYLGNLLDQNAQPKANMTMVIPETTFRFEDTLPMGKVSIYDAEHDADEVVVGIWGKTASGGSNWIWGTVENGGRGAIWGGGGGGFQSYINNIKYTLSDTTGYFNITISLGTTNDETASKLKQLDVLSDNLRQRG